MGFAMAPGRTAGNEHSTPSDPGMLRLDRNINAILKQREEDKRNRTVQDKIAEKITNFAGSMAFIYLHVVIFGSWIAANLGLLPNVPVFDPTFAVLAMVASVEAIFISTFVLISQNRMAANDDKRADLNLQISLLAEQEATRLLTLVSAIAERLQVKTPADGDVGELATEITPEEVLRRLEKQGDHSKE
jgi:uncharacterized membrane protein